VTFGGDFLPKYTRKTGFEYEKKTGNAPKNFGIDSENLGIAPKNLGIEVKKT